MSVHPAHVKMVDHVHMASIIILVIVLMDTMVQTVKMVSLLVLAHKLPYYLQQDNWY